MRPGDVQKISHPGGAPETKLYFFWPYQELLYLGPVPTQKKNFYFLLSAALENLEASNIDYTDEDYRAAFALLDGDGNGEITKADLQVFIKTQIGSIYFQLKSNQFKSLKIF